MSESAAPEPESVSGSQHAKQFFINVIWTWIGVAANVFTGFFLSPYIIRKLGDERYGIWALAFALIEYVFLFDLGFRSAVVNYTSRFRARGEPEHINEVINTALTYFSGVAALVMVLALAFSDKLSGFFQISPAYRREFSTLVLLVAFNWAAGFVFSTFQASLEAFQQFRVYNHIYIATLVIRSTGCAILLYLGHGLVAMGIMVVGSQASGWIMNLLMFRRIFTPLRFSRVYVRWERLKQMASYGIHSFVAHCSTLLLNQGPPVLIGHFQPAAFVGYYSLPLRLLQYAVEAISRIGFVTAPNTAELIALGKRTYVVQLGIYLNRYCFAVFVPFSVFVLIYGPELVRIWVGPTFAVHSSPLLPPFAIAVSFALAGQFNSSSILFGMARHHGFARSLLVEAMAVTIGLFLVLPRYGILGAAWVVSACLFLNRGLVTPWLLCRNLDFPFVRYIRSIYLQPLIAALIAAAAIRLLKDRLLPGATWPQLLLAQALIVVVHYGICAITCIEPDHRDLLKQWSQRLMQRLLRRG